MDSGTSENVSNQFDDIVSLVLARSRGEVENDAVENALASLVGSNEPPNPVAESKVVESNVACSNPTQQTIIPDCENYDDDSDNTPKPPAKRPRGRPRKNPEFPPPDLRREGLIEQIPLGKMGERMLVTFGDGPRPRPEVIDAALMGARICLQKAILDARALRRQLKEKWQKAKDAANNRAPAGDIDVDMYFKALEGTDRLKFNLPCGFDTAQLEQLFPEEMRAYQRWKKMHKAYSQNSGDDIKGCKKQIDDNDDNVSDTESFSPENDYDTTTKNDTDDEDEINSSGRLIQRLANFDARTNRMKSDYYLRFADVRRGSFLPRRGQGGTNETKEWKEKKKMSKRGVRSSWQTLHPSSVAFLHWVGFDQRSALAPPNEATTQALGFLAYDIFGKIVEKAVSLRLESTKKSAVKKNNSNRGDAILELGVGDQLEKTNIDDALKAVNMKSLYSSTNADIGKSSEVAQLYFGPGFEDRLEIELDEMFGHKQNTLSEEEIKVRKEEENLFSEISRLPTRRE
mmetsp:Transcript_14760/g.27939  ORF Transcript_14760/g.27939 Transcript_14760/m.27939 type:complete len:515 (-) Transcript_14760:147-1691(-)